MKKKRRRRRRRRWNPRFLWLCFILFVLLLGSLVGIISFLKKDTPPACGIEGHYKKDGLIHKELQSDCSNGHSFSCQCSSWIVPESGIYYEGVESSSLGDYSNAKNTLSGKSQLPCGSSPKIGDVFVCGDYEYRYACRWSNGWTFQRSQNGWGVRVLDTEKSSYGEILDSINNANVVSLYATFQGCTALESAPELPVKAEDITFCFAGCSLLKDPPLIHDGITAAAFTFQNCESLVSAPIFPQSLSNMTGTFSGCKSLNHVPSLPGCVMNMERTFEGCSALMSTPEIPVTVDNLTGTFAGCRRITEPPVIPYGVKNLDYTFAGCTLLKSTPHIPDDVISMRATFQDCASLITAPNIPSNVMDMTETFAGCISMKGYIVIFADPVQYSRCLSGTQIDEILGSTNLKESFLRTVTR